MKTKIYLILISITMSSITIGQIINVPEDYPTIQQGIEAATSYDTMVLVAPGTYYENINFIGKAITVASNYIMSGDTNHINNTVIDGSQPANPDSASVVSFISGEDTTSVICGFTITGGTGTIIGGTRYGGGIYCSYAGARIIHNKIINNTSEHSNDSFGGGIGCRYGSSWIVIRDNTIRDNVVSSDNIAKGGGIYSRNNSQLISNNVISHDSLSGYNSYGGGIYLSYSDYTEMTGNIITGNILNMIEVGSGAGVFCNYPQGPLNVFQNEFSYNIGGKTVFNSGSGGGLFIWNAYDYPVVVDGNQFLYNSVWFGGGFYEKNSYNLKLTNNVFIGNDTFRGGAVGIWHADGSNNYRPQFINNTFFNNSASEYGDAITYYGDFIGCSPVIMNCIVWENAGPPFWEEITNLSSDTVFVFNSNINNEAIYGPWYGKNNFDEDPELEDDSIHLLGSSPCINMGTEVLEINGTTYSCPDFDIDGDPRPLNDTVDVGADEYDLDVGIVSLDNTLDDLSIQISPNPFTVSADIKLNLQSAGQVELNLFDYSGRKVRALKNNNLQAGIHEIKIDLNDLKPGIYFCSLKTNEGIITKKMIKLD